MPAKSTYLVRGPDGRMNTVIAHSIRGAAKLFMAKVRGLRAGDLVSVKLRGQGDWTDYKVGRG